MILGQMSKVFAVVAQATVATNATASVGPFDISSFGAVIVEAIHNPAAATNSSAKWAALSVLVGDTTTYSEATAVNGLVGTTNTTASTSQFVLGVHNDTSLSGVTRMSLNGNRNKYLFINRQVPGATNYNVPAFVVQGFHGPQAPSSASEAGLSAWASSGGN